MTPPAARSYSGGHRTELAAISAIGIEVEHVREMRRRKRNPLQVIQIVERRDRSVAAAHQQRDHEHDSNQQR